MGRTVDDLLKDLYDLGHHVDLGQYMLLVIENTAIQEMTAAYINEPDPETRDQIVGFVLFCLLNIARG
jgi:hypothetical protein